MTYRLTLTIATWSWFSLFGHHNAMAQSNGAEQTSGQEESPLYGELCGSQNAKTQEQQIHPAIITEYDKWLCIKRDFATLTKNQRFTKYFTLTHIYNRGDADQLPAFKETLRKLLNGLTFAERQRQFVDLVAVDPLGTILRADISILKWTEDDWKTVMLSDPYRSILELSVSPSVAVRGDWFLNVEGRLGQSSTLPFYYAEYAQIWSNPPMVDYNANMNFTLIANELGLSFEALQEIVDSDQELQKILPYYSDDSVIARSAFEQDYDAIMMGLWQARRIDTVNSIDGMQSLQWSDISAGPQPWIDAYDRCSSLAQDGHRNWRLPTAGELLQLKFLGIPVESSLWTRHAYYDGDSNDADATHQLMAVYADLFATLPRRFSEKEACSTTFERNVYNCYRSKGRNPFDEIFKVYDVFSLLRAPGSQTVPTLALPSNWLKSICVRREQ